MPRGFRPMVRINLDFDTLPLEVKGHIDKRIVERKLSPEDLSKMRYWVRTYPHAFVDEHWYKDFDTFYLVGWGATPKSVLGWFQDKQGIWKRMIPYGRKLAFSSQLLN